MTSFLSVGTPDGDIDPLQTLASDPGPSFLFLFLLFTSLGSWLQTTLPPRTPRAWANRTRCRRGRAVTLQLVSIYGPDAQKESEWVERTAASLCAVRT